MRRFEEHVELSLDESWSECLRMWNDLDIEDYEDGYTGIDELKDDWLKANEYSGVRYDCFFCDYAERISGTRSVSAGMCRECPGRVVDKHFYCMNNDIDYMEYPVALRDRLNVLYRRYKELNEVRNG